MASKIRDRIITHAIRCFANDGYSGSSTKRIAAKANVTEGSLFRLCSCKENLFTEALTTALSCKKIKRVHVRIAAFAVLESRGLTPANLKAIRRLAKSSTCIQSLLAISK